MYFWLPAHVCRYRHTRFCYFCTKHLTILKYSCAFVFHFWLEVIFFWLSWFIIFYTMEKTLFFLKNDGYYALDGLHRQICEMWLNYLEKRCFTLQIRLLNMHVNAITKPSASLDLSNLPSLQLWKFTLWCLKTFRCIFCFQVLFLLLQTSFCLCIVIKMHSLMYSCFLFTFCSCYNTCKQEMSK